MMTSARPNAPAKLRALLRLANGEPDAQDMTTADSNHLLRHGLVDVDRGADGRRQHSITAAGWALLDESSAPAGSSSTTPRSANPPRSGHGIAVGDVVAYTEGRTLSGAYRVRHAHVVGFDNLDRAGERVVLNVPGHPDAILRPLAEVTRVDPPPTAYREDLTAEPAAHIGDGASRSDRQPGTVEFQGKAYAIRRLDVETRMRGLLPDRITKYFVEINGHAYPVKQVARACTGVYEQNTRESQQFLRALGFTVHRRS